MDGLAPFLRAIGGIGCASKLTPVRKYAAQLAGGAVRVVLFEHARGNWAAYISTDVSMSVEAILQTVYGRWSIEASQAECVLRTSLYQLAA
ncbi:hypothetical protein [Roseimaritima sediminicola]|uniref:hypothetical protein n=1 Tax=Roseimaritima sediminicola TaxID=2662066 RepID=UPI0012985093|nr:hypothetical protein [Roseimaritima sediminicola]